MTTIPNPQAVRKIAYKLLLNAATELVSQNAARNISSAIKYEAGGSLTMLEHTAWFDAVYQDVMSAKFVPSWSGEPPEDGDIQAARAWLADLFENIRSFHQSIPGQPGCTCGRSLACGNDVPDYAAIWTLEAALNAWTPTEQDEQTQDAGPRVVCLCGSSRFRAEHDVATRDLTMAGRIVLGLGTFSHSDGTVLSDAEKAMLDKLHLAKIDLADEVVVVSPGGYIGASTAAEIAYAEKIGKPVRYLTAPASAQDERDGDLRAPAPCCGGPHAGWIHAVDCTGQRARKAPTFDDLCVRDAGIEAEQ